MWSLELGVFETSRDNVLGNVFTKDVILLSRTGLSANMDDDLAVWAKSHCPEHILHVALVSRRSKA